MNRSEFSQKIEQWIGTSLRSGGDPREHCHGLRKAFALSEDHVVDFLSFRHREPAAPDAPHLFTVQLWRCLDGAVTTQTVREMGVSMILVRAAYAQLMEEAECRGWRRRHRFTVHGNIVGARVERNPLIDTLSVGGGELSFWTFRDDEGRLAVEPYYVDDPVEGVGRIETVLDHLAWDESEAGPEVREPQVPVCQETPARGIL